MRQLPHIVFLAILLVSTSGDRLRAGEEEAPRKPLSPTELRKAVCAYITADAQKRAAILARLEGSDTLKRGDEKKWTKAICKELKKSLPKVKAKKTDLLAKLDDRRRGFNRQMGISEGPVATFKTPSGDMRVILDGKSKKRAGALIFLHGGGNVGAAHPGHLDNEMAWGWAYMRAKKIRCASQMIVPRCLDDKATNAWILVPEVRAVDAVVDWLVASREVDPDRVFLVGQSMGGFGVWKSAAIHGDRFAAIVDLTGSCTAGAQEMANYRNVDFGIFMGATDSRTASARKGADALKALHAEDKDGYRVSYKEYAGMGHGLKDSVYKDVDAYLKDKKRDAYPRLVVWNPQVDWKTRFYNIGIASPRKGMSVRAHMGKDNHIKLTTSGVQAITVYLNADLVDLKKPVKVTWNEAEAFEGLVPARLGVLLETLVPGGDTGMVYTAKISLKQAAP